MQKLASELNKTMATMIKQRVVDISQTKRGVVVDISASTLFGAGETALQAGSLNVLREVAVVLAKEDLAIEVEGHTTTPPSTRRSSLPTGSCRQYAPAAWSDC